MEARKQDEMAFHDALREHRFEQRWSRDAERQTAGDPLWSNFKYYSIERQNIAFVKSWLQSRCAGKCVLDFGCGNGEDSIFVARHGAAEVVGIDISEVAIANCRRRAAVEGVEEKASFVVQDGESLEFPDNSFDVAMEYGVLHHVDLEKVMGELGRVLKPGGSAVFVEALGHNLLINAYRRLTPHLRTPWETEHLLRKERLEVIRRHFAIDEVKLFHLATLAAVPFRKTRIFPYLLGALETVDRVVLRLPVVSWQAWIAVITVTKAHRSDAQR
jgi:SAM-dependent methyltransferase